MSMNWISPAHPEFLTTDNRCLPVNRIFCIAKNYEEHAKEMGGEVDRKAPVHFQKSFDALTFGPNVRYPSHTDDLHHEVELVAVDDWISTNQEKRCDYNFLNIDVQGYELEALRGLQKQLLNIDAIYSEINYEYLYENGALVSDVDQFLASHGFKRVATETVKGMGWGEALYIKGITLQLKVYLKFRLYMIDGALLRRTRSQM